MNWGAAGVEIATGGVAALAVAPFLAGWSRALTSGPDPGWWRIPWLSPERWVTSRSPTTWVTTAVAVLLGGAAAVLAPAPAWWLLGTGGAVLAVVDWRTHRLPARFVYPLAGVIAAVLFAAAAVSGAWPDLLRAALAASLIGGLWFGVAFVSPAAVGMGDIRVAALTAGLLGWLGWPAVLLGQFLVSLLGVVTAIVIVAAGRRPAAGLRVPMGSALVAGAFLAAMLG